MGRSKTGYNWRAREQHEGEIGVQEIEKLKGKVKLEGKGQEGAGYEGSNQLALPQQRLKLTKVKKVQAVGKILSKKQRKRLEKIVDQKKKKEERVDLISKLQSVQRDDLSCSLESLSSAQTKGLKRQLAESKEVIRIMQTEGLAEHEINKEVMVRSKKRRKLKEEPVEEIITNCRTDVVGFDISGSESEDSEEEEESIINSTEAIEKEIVVPENIESPEIETENDDTKIKPVNVDGEEEIVLAANSYKPANMKLVQVNRSQEMAESRGKLPIISEEQQIIETINSQSFSVLTGETGSGKTTQLPQFLYESGYASGGQIIGVTEPRRVAATAMASRVGQELGLPPSVVSYQIRYEGTVTDQTKIKFMTDGVLLREVEKDFLLSNYSVIIIDEAHERSVFTDILIGLLSRIVPLRHKKNNPLKVVIMSATLRVSDFTENTRLFKVPPPVISVESRQFPVTVHFNRRTVDDYLGEAFRKVCKINSQLPEGGILVFVTGQQEVNTLVKKLRERFPCGKTEDIGDEEKDMEKVLMKEANIRKKAEKKPTVTQTVSSSLPEIDLSNYKIQPLDDTETDAMEDEDIDLDMAVDDEYVGSAGSSTPLHVLPLYSLLTSERQSLIWAGAPPGTRLCVVATNVAETSLTIPGVKYIVDSGKAKVKYWDKVTGVSTFQVDWCSQAQANQRAGRAGRQGAGHAYRLYSSAVFNDMSQFSVPEIQQRPVDDLLLQMKSMNITKVVNFPFPTSPDILQLRTAEKRLQILGALSSPPSNLPLKEADKLRFSSKVTSLGRCISTFPLAPRFGKMLALAHQHNLLPLAVALVSALTVQEVIVERGLPEETEDKKPPQQLRELRRLWAGQGSSLQLGDAAVLLRAVIEAQCHNYCPQFCQRAGIRYKAMQEIRRLRRQLISEVEKVLPGEKEYLNSPHLDPPDQCQSRLLQQLLLAGSPHMVARRLGEKEGGEKGAYRAGAMEQPVYIHQSSVLRQSNPGWLIYQELFETNSGRIVMRGVTEISPEWLPTFCPALCNLGSPLEDPTPRYCPRSGRVMSSYCGTFGPASWNLPATEQEMFAGLDKFKWFGRFLLEGSVAPKLKTFKTSLLSNPLVMVKSWSNLQKRTELLVKDLASESVDSGKKLKDVWSRNPDFLLKAYQAWLPEVLHVDLKSSWPPEISFVE